MQWNDQQPAKETAETDGKYLGARETEAATTQQSTEMNNQPNVRIGRGAE